MRFIKSIDTIVHYLISITLCLLKQILKFSVSIVLLLVCFVLTWGICSQYLTMELDFGKAFETTIQAPPSMANADGQSIQLKGVGGDKVIIGFRMPDIIRKDSGEVKFITTDRSSEKLSVTPRKQSEIQASLTELDPQKWQILTKLPTPIFRYNIYLFSDITSLNKAKKASFFLITGVNGDAKKVMPGENIELGQNLQIGEISRTLSETGVDLVYEMGWYMSFYDKNGKFVSQATGKIEIRPNFLAKASIFIGVWMILLGLIALLKQTLLVTKDFEQIKEHYKRRK